MAKILFKKKTQQVTLMKRLNLFKSSATDHFVDIVLQRFH